MTQRAVVGTRARRPVAEPDEGKNARERLLLAGLHLFAEQGYAKTSIRQIAWSAGANVASVSYYFGSKAELYRAIFGGQCFSADDATEWPIATMGELFRHILEPLRKGKQARLLVKLRRREMLEPTGLCGEKGYSGIRAMHDSLVGILCARLQVEAADDAVEALAMLVIAPAIHLLTNCDVIDILAPQLLMGSDAVDVWCERLSRSAQTLIAAERRRRKRGAAADRQVSTAALRRRARPTRTPNRQPRDSA